MINRSQEPGVGSQPPSLFELWRAEGENSESRMRFAAFLFFPPNSVSWIPFRIQNSDFWILFHNI